MSLDHALTVPKGAEPWMYDADGGLMKPELALYHQLRLTDQQWRDWFDVVDGERNARTRGRNGVKMLGLTGDPQQPRWVQTIDALIDIGRVDEADRDDALKSEWVKYSGCPGCGSSGAFLRRDRSSTYEHGQVRLSCGRRCQTRDVLRELQIETTPPVTVLAKPSSPEAPTPTPPRESAESAELGGWKGFGFLHGDELEALDLPEEAWLFDNLIPVAGLALLAGPPKSCKSYLAIGLSLAVCGSFADPFADPHPLSPALSALSADSAREGPFRANRTGSVLYFSPDDPNEKRFRNRVHAVSEGRPTPRGLLSSFTQTPGIGATFADRLIAELDSRNSAGSAESAELPPVRMVVIDTFQRVKGHGQGDGDRYAADVASLVHLRRVCVAHPEVAILLLHHTRKRDPKRDSDPLELVSGTQGLAGGVDHVLVLEVPADRGPARTLNVMGRDGEDHKLALTMTGHGLVPVDEDPDDPARMLSAASGAVYRTLREFPNGATAAEIAQVAGIESKVVSDRLRRMADGGLVVRLERGTYRTAEWTGDTR